jgi:hypothetical protein
MTPMLFVTCYAFAGEREDTVHDFLSVCCDVHPLSFGVRKNRDADFCSVHSDDRGVANKIFSMCKGLHFHDRSILVRPWENRAPVAFAEARTQRDKDFKEARTWQDAVVGVRPL